MAVCVVFRRTLAIFLSLTRAKSLARIDKWSACDEQSQKKTQNVTKMCPKCMYENVLFFFISGAHVLVRLYTHYMYKSVGWLLYATEALRTTYYSIICTYVQFIGWAHLEPPPIFHTTIHAWKKVGGGSNVTLRDAVLPLS